MRSWWNVGAWYGLLLAVTTFVVLLALPHPLGARLLWSVVALQLLTGAWLVWSRTRLPWATAAMAVAGAGAAWCAIEAVSPLHRESQSIRALAVIVVAGLGAGLLDHVQARVAPEAWERWRKHMATCTLRDVLLGRHIPSLRNGAGAPGRRAG